MRDYFIVGFGLAGLTLANELQKRDQSFLVFDDSICKASGIAGGIINPLILKRFTKAWKAEQFIPKAEKVYRDLEAHFGMSFLHQIPIYRKIKSAKEQNDWFVASDKPELKAFMDDRLKPLNKIEGEYDFGKVLQTSFLETDKLLKTFSRQLTTDGHYINERFDYEAVEFLENGVRYKGKKARKIVFCEGFGLLKNPYFRSLPLIGNKGEYLILKIPCLQLKGIVKTALALIPLGNDYYKFGATYSRDFKNTASEAGARQFLIRKLEEIIDCPYTIVDTEVGIRPTVLDRRPLLGAHPKHRKLLVYNGLGSHGVMISPTAAQWLVDSENEKQPLPKIVDAQRYLNRG